jgi:MFS superfamily sulfate permease-like transporter
MTAAWQRLRLFLTFWDSRFEDVRKDTWLKTTYRDLSAGLVVALTAIPMAMGFAMAAGLEPEQGIIAGAIACLVGRTFGGSKYQVYGPTAAFIPVIAGLMAKYGGGEAAHAFLVLCSLVAGVALMVMGLTGMGKYAKYVPNSIVVGFTVGIAITIALSNAGGAFGYKSEITGGLANKLSLLWEHRAEFNGYALGLALLTFALTRGLLKVSIFIPAPLIGMGVATLLATTVLAGQGIVNIRDEYGDIPTHFFVFTPPGLPGTGLGVWLDLAYFAVAIVFVSAVESLLCSSMADRLADNRGTPFNPDKEFWGQGLVQIVTPLINGFPCTGALARTAASIKVGAVTPLAGYFKGGLKLTLAYFLAPYLELVPMACIGGILLWVASNMVKPAEIREVWRHGWLDAGIMVYTAAMVPLTDFLTGVLSAMVIYAILWKLSGLAGRRPAADPADRREPVVTR